MPDAEHAPHVGQWCDLHWNQPDEGECPGCVATAALRAEIEKLKQKHQRKQAATGAKLSDALARLHAAIPPCSGCGNAIAGWDGRVMCPGCCPVDDEEPADGPSGGRYGGQSPLSPDSDPAPLTTSGSIERLCVVATGDEPWRAADLVDLARAEHAALRAERDAAMAETARVADECQRTIARLGATHRDTLDSLDAARRAALTEVATLREEVDLLQCQREAAAKRETHLRAEVARLRSPPPAALVGAVRAIEPWLRWFDVTCVPDHAAVWKDGVPLTLGQVRALLAALDTTTPAPAATNGDDHG